VWVVVDQGLPSDSDAVPALSLSQPRRRLRSTLHVQWIPVGARCHTVPVQTRVGVQLGNRVSTWRLPGVLLWLCVCVCVMCFRWNLLLSRCWWRLQSERSVMGWLSEYISIIRPYHCAKHMMRPVVTVVAWSVCLSACLSACLSVCPSVYLSVVCVNPTKQLLKQWRRRFVLDWDSSSRGPRNHVLRVARIPSP